MLMFSQRWYSLRNVAAKLFLPNVLAISSSSGAVFGRCSRKAFASVRALAQFVSGQRGAKLPAAA